MKYNNYLDNFKPHKIPGIDKKICCCEQKIAYNYLFSWSSSGEKYKILDLISKSLNEGKETNFKKYDIDLIYHYILQSYDRYLAAKSPIFTSYEALASVIYSEVYKPE